MLAFDDDEITRQNQFRNQEIGHAVAQFPLSFKPGTIVEGGHGHHRRMSFFRERGNGIHQGHIASGEQEPEGNTQCDFSRCFH